jgi:hypothetical protein
MIDATDASALLTLEQAADTLQADCVTLWW